MKTVLRLRAFLKSEKCPLPVEGNYWLCKSSLSFMNIQT